MSMKHKIDIVKAFQEHIRDKDKTDAYNLIHDQARWHSDEIGAPWSGIYHGKENIKKHFDSISGTTQNFKRFEQYFIEHNDMVIEIGSLSCILCKTGKPFSTEYVCIWHVDYDKITSYRIFEDSLKLYRAYYPDEN